MSLTYTGVYPTVVNTTTTTITGSTRFNGNTNQFEMYDGQQWVAVSTGEVHDITLAEMVEDAEDRISSAIEEEYADNVTIQDAFKEWQEANDRFKVILTIAEKNK